MEYFTIINSVLLLAIGSQVLALRKQGITTPLLRQRRERMVILDSCALIDGRIVDLVKLGFTKDTLVIPQSVVAELQYLADQGDSHKRERARFGLDVVRELQDLAANTIIDRTTLGSRLPVDEQLIVTAQKLNGVLYTTDFNLNKVAQIHGVEVLNVNELTQRMRAKILPGEQDEIKIVNRGQDKTQGVGYLDDGTMVVIEKAGSKVGQTIQVQFSRALQTQAGRMMFATMAGASKTDENHAKPKHVRSSKAEEVVILQTTKKTPATAPVKPVQQHVEPQQAPHTAEPTEKRKPAHHRKRRDSEGALLQLVASQHDEAAPKATAVRKASSTVSSASTAPTAAKKTPRRVYHARPKKTVTK
jgi:rRNA-processing protein FCF1